MGEKVIVWYGDVWPKPVEPGDIVVCTQWSSKPRMVACVGKHSISFVRLRSSHIWKNSKGRNATAWHPLPMTLIVVQRATPETRALAAKFEGWMNEEVTTKDWDRVCDLRVAAIRCGCGSRQPSAAMAPQRGRRARR